ncbi:MAG: hypothetical protein KBT11_07255 [Treponema sp.]|nr:hypothetical protein [Candidatus Treponema equifaecale]
MKKIFAVLTALLCFAGFAFADEVSDLLKEPQDSTTRTIVPEEQHTVNKTAKVMIEYTPLVDEVHIYYTCMAVSYDQGEAMNTVMACLNDFKTQNQYYAYKYLRKDSVKYFKDDKNLRWATYSSYVKFNR